MYRSVFPDLRFALEDVIAEGDTVAWRITARGTHQGALMGIPPTGKPVAISALVISHFVDSKWAEDWVNIDTLGMLQQIGAIPAPGQAG
jgi:predicted ester cyclase